MGSVVVVIIVGVIVVAVTVIAVSGGPKPATRPGPSHRAPRPAVAREPVVWGGLPDRAAAPGDRRVPRLRALVLLLAAVVGLGTTAAAVLGLAILVVARTVDGALG